MGKNKNSSVKRPKTAAKNDATGFPSFDERALSALTEKIEKGLGKGKGSQQAAESVNRSHEQQEKSSGHKQKESNNVKALEPARGTKRDAKGNVKKATPTSNPGRSKQNTSAAGDRVTLLQEILALGGTEEDLELVADAASDDEELDARDSAAPDKALKKELAKFVASLGIDAQIEAEEGESEDDQAVDDEWEEVSDLDAETESGDDIEEAKPSPPTPDLKTKTKDTAPTKDANRLVRISRSRSAVRLTSNRYLKLEPIGMQPPSQNYRNQNPKNLHSSAKASRI
jgi:ribosome biogenesis protein MAK21